MGGSLKIFSRRDSSADLRFISKADRWRIDDVRIGNRSQMLSTGGISGALFSCAAVDPPAFRFETVQTAMDFVLEVSYVGPLPDGEVFEAAILGVGANGDLARLARHRLEFTGEISPAQINDIVTRVRAAAAAGVVVDSSVPRLDRSIDEGEYACHACGAISVRWSARCALCHAWSLSSPRSRL